MVSQSMYLDDILWLGYKKSKIIILGRKVREDFIPIGSQGCIATFICEKQREKLEEHKCTLLIKTIKCYRKTTGFTKICDI